jgi:RNA-directed DNA polymerase
LKHFFYDITEIDVYKILMGLGYRNLLAFELARLCTTTHLPKPLKCLLYHYPNEENFSYPDQMGYVGVLPQGAPSSPMLANLAALELDKKLHKFCIENGFVYTRYADDLTISAIEILSKLSIGSIHRKIIGIIRKCRFKENPDKTRIAGPGSKKIVLGLLVDDSTPRLSKETFKRIDRHLHATERYGLEATANHEKFDSPFGFYNHLSGLVAFVKDVDIKRWEKFMPRLKAIKVPWQDEIGGFQ